jgi:AbrB family looped-hinge helix DNA binding protein
MKRTIDEAGRIELPADLRMQLGVNPGDELELEQRAGEWVIRPSRVDSGLCWEGNVLVHKGRNIGHAAIDDVIEQVRNERLDQLSEGLTE